jgi:hypothetical protein
MVEISCPYCNFSKTIPKERIPEKARWATCPKCKKRFVINLQEGRVNTIHKPESTSPGDEPDRKTIPGNQKKAPGFFPGILRTFRQVLFSPHKLFDTMSLKRGYGESLAFGLLFGSLGMMLGFFWQLLIIPDRFIQLGKFLFGSFNLSTIYLVLIILTPLWVMVQLFLMALILHWCLIVFGGGKSGFEATFSVISYSQAIQLLSVFPLIGGFIGFFWQLIVQIIGLREIHNTTYHRVMMAYILPPVLIIFFIVLIAVIFFSFL